MNSRRSLQNREHGYELSGVEHALLFEQEDTGYLRKFGTSKTYFYLDPSPFFRNPKPEIYVLKTEQIPPPGELIKVTSVENETVVREVFGKFRKFTFKHVYGWEIQSPNQFMNKKKIEPEEYINFFKTPFVGLDEYKDQLSFCLALSTMSSQVKGANGKGGIDSGIKSNKNSWNAFRRMMKIIPNDFRKRNSTYYFNQFGKENYNLDTIESSEVNLSILDPLKTPVHIPMTLNMELKKPQDYKELVDVDLPAMRGYMLDAILLKPEPSHKIEKYMEDCIYDMVDLFTSSKSITYNPDLGSSAPKLSSAFARLKFEDKISKDDVKESVSLWTDMYHHSIRSTESNLSYDELFKLSPRSYTLYRELEDKYQIENTIPISVINNETSLSSEDVNRAISELKRVGAIYSPNNKIIKLIDFKL